MANKEQIYPEGYPRQGENFSNKVKFKTDVFDVIKEIALDTTEKAFEDKGYKKKEGRAGEYGDESSYGVGAANKMFNIRLSSRPNTNTYIEKIIYFGGKKAISIISIGWDAKNETIEVSYKTSEFAAFRGYGKESGAELINERENFVIKSVSAFKTKLKDIFKKYAEKEVAYITSTKIGIEDKTEKSIDSMVESKINKELNAMTNNFSIKSLMTSSNEELSSSIDKYISESKQLNENKQVTVAYSLDGGYNVKRIPVMASTVKDAFDKTVSAGVPAKDIFEIHDNSGILLWSQSGGHQLPTNSLHESKKESDKEDKTRMNSPEVIAANSPNKLLFDDVEDIKDENFKTVAKNKLKKFGVIAINELKPSEKKTYFEELEKELEIQEITGGGAGGPGGAVGGAYLTPSSFKKGGDLNLEADEATKEKLAKTSYAQGQKQRPSVKKTMKEGDTFWTTVELNPGSGYVPKGMERNFVMGQHGEKDTYTGKMNESIERTPEVLKESLIKRKFTSMNENTEKGINKKYIVTEQRTKAEEESRWNRLAMFESNETIRKAERVTDDADYIAPEPKEIIKESNLLQRNSDAEAGGVVDGRNVIIVAKPGSLSNAMFKVYEDDYLNEGKAYILDLNSGNLVSNPNFSLKK